MTARFDNAIGRTAIRAAYAHCDRDIAHSLTDGDALRMAYTTRHQIETARAYAAARLAGRYLEIGFEEILADPGATRARVADWLGATPVSALLDTEIDPGRAQSGSDPYPEPIAGQVAAVLADLRRSLGYPKRDPKSGNRFPE
jgi:hypothetical protein